MMGMKIPTRSMELMLLGWQDHHNTGFKVTFEVPPEDEDYFRNATSKKGKIAGQRYAVVLVELGPDEQPVQGSADRKLTPAEKKAQTSLPITPAETKTEDLEPVRKPHFPEGLTGLAVRWCGDGHFQDWLMAEHPEKWDAAAVRFPGLEDRAKFVVCEICGVESRKELNTNIEAEHKFRFEILQPYKELRKADGLDQDDAPF